MISTTKHAGGWRATVVDGDWRYDRSTWHEPWTATHEPTGTTLNTGETQLDDAKQRVRVERPDLCPAPAPLVGYTVVRGRQSKARPGQASR